MFVGRPAELLQARWRAERRLDLLELGDPRHRAGDLDPAAVRTWVDAVQLAERVVAVLLQPERARLRVDSHPEAVAVTVREDLLDVGADLAAHRRAGGEERVVRWGVPSSFSRRTTPVRWALSGSGPPNWSSGTVGPGHVAVGPHGRFCSWPRRPTSPMKTYSLPSVPKASTPPSWLPRSGWFGILLERPQLDQVAVEGERRPVPHVAVDAVAQQRRLAEHVGVRAGRALRPVQVDARVGREVRMQGDPEQPALRGGVDGEVEHGALHHAVDHPLHLAGVLLQHQHVVGADERHGDRQVETLGHGPHAETRVQHDRSARLGGGRRRRPGGDQHAGGGEHSPQWAKSSSASHALPPRSARPIHKLRPSEGRGLRLPRPRRHVGRH